MHKIQTIINDFESITYVKAIALSFPTQSLLLYGNLKLMNDTAYGDMATGYKNSKQKKTIMRHSCTF